MALQISVRIEGTKVSRLESELFGYTFDLYEAVKSEVGQPNPFAFAVSLDEIGDEIADQLEDEGLEVADIDIWERREEELLEQREPFFDPEHGLACLKAYSTYFRKRSQERYRSDRHLFMGRDLADDLDEICADLEAARENGKRFRIEVG